jgi:hypothetical protein
MTSMKEQPVDIPSLETHKDFSGSAEELARLASDLCGALGMATEELSVRLVRDYAQRDILSRPERQGKEAVYTWRHLVELVAARALLADGWPLAKITEHFALTPFETLLSLIPGQRPGGSALDAARRIRSTAAAVRDAAPDFALMMPSAPPSERMASQRQMRIDLHTAMQQLGGRGASPRITPMTRIALDDDIQLLIATERIRNLSLEEADAVGRAVTASIVDWIAAKGGKQP